MKSPKRFFDTIQFMGVFLGILLSIILIFPANQEPIGSVILGLCVTIIFQIFDLQQRQSDSEDTLLDVAKMHKDFYHDEFLYKNIRDIVSDYYTIKNGWFSVFQRRATDIILDNRNIMHSMAEGYMIVDINSPMTFGIKGIESATQSVKAVTVEDILIWLDNVGEKYMNVNKDAVQRGVKITRVFIQPKNQIDMFNEILQQQKLAGIDVYIAYSDQLPSDLYEDYLIVDESVCVNFGLASDKEAREQRN